MPPLSSRGSGHALTGSWNLDILLVIGDIIKRISIVYCLSSIGLLALIFVISSYSIQVSEYYRQLFRFKHGMLPKQLPTIRFHSSAKTPAHFTITSSFRLVVRNKAVPHIYEPDLLLLTQLTELFLHIDCERRRSPSFRAQRLTAKDGNVRLHICIV